MASGDRRRLLRTITVPTRVLHGGRDAAAHIPGAVFREIEGMAQDLPDALVPRLADEIASHCERADRQPAA